MGKQTQVAETDQVCSPHSVARICSYRSKSAANASLRKRSAWPNTTSKNQSGVSARRGREATLSSPSPSLPRRGDIWLVNFDPTVGTEIQKTRPAVVVLLTPWDVFRLNWWRPLLTGRSISRPTSGTCGLSQMP